MHCDILRPQYIALLADGRSNAMHRVEVRAGDAGRTGRRRNASGCGDDTWNQNAQKEEMTSPHPKLTTTRQQTDTGDHQSQGFCEIAVAGGGNEPGKSSLEESTVDYGDGGRRLCLLPNNTKGNRTVSQCIPMVFTAGSTPTAGVTKCQEGATLAKES